MDLKGDTVEELQAEMEGEEEEILEEEELETEIEEESVGSEVETEESVPEESESEEAEEAPTEPETPEGEEALEEQQPLAEDEQVPTIVEGEIPEDQQPPPEAEEISPEAVEGEIPEDQQPPPEAEEISPETVEGEIPEDQQPTPEGEEMPPETVEGEIPEDQQPPPEGEEAPMPSEEVKDEIPEEQQPPPEEEQPPTVEKAPSIKSVSSTTVKNLMTSLEEKCRTKDKMISALTNELQLRARSNVWKNLLNDLASIDSATEPPCDFDEDKLCKYLRKPSDSTVIASPQRFFSSPLASKLQTESTPTLLVEVKPRFRHKDTSDMPMDLQEPPAARSAQSVSDLAIKPVGLHVIRQLEPDSLLLGWNAPPQSSLSGFEIYINGVFAHKVHSPMRNKALIRNVNLSSRMVISLYALTDTGRLSEPAYAVYSDKAITDQDMQASPSPALPSS